MMRRPRRVLAVVAVAVAGLGACTGDGDGTSTATDPTTTAPTTTERPTTTSTTTTTTEAPMAGVPYDDDLLDRLPDLSGFDMELGDVGRPFADELCDGDDAPARPEAQGVGRYRNAGDVTVLIAGYRFAGRNEAAAYASAYGTAVRGCTDGPRPRDVYVVDAAELFAADTDEAFGEMMLVLAGDELWVGLIQFEDEPVGFSDAAIAAVIAAAEEG